MNVLLTDVLTCPRCGPEFGLILLAHEVRERRVREGELGCPNCRDRFPIHRGFADLRAPPRSPLDDTPEEIGAEEGSGPDPLTLAACLAVTEGPGFMVFIGEVGLAAASVAGLVGGVEVVVVEPRAARWPQSPGVSRLAVWPGLPFRGGARGLVIDRDHWPEWKEEVLRVAGPQARIVLVGPDPEGSAPADVTPLVTVLDESGYTVLARE